MVSRMVTPHGVSIVTVIVWNDHCNLMIIVANFGQGAPEGKRRGHSYFGVVRVIYCMDQLDTLTAVPISLPMWKFLRLHSSMHPLLVSRNFELRWPTCTMTFTERIRLLNTPMRM